MAFEIGKKILGIAFFEFGRRDCSYRAGHFFFLDFLIACDHDFAHHFDCGAQHHAERLAGVRLAHGNVAGEHAYITYRQYGLDGIDFERKFTVHIRYRTIVGAADGYDGPDQRLALLVGD